MYDVGSKLLGRIRNIYVDILACQSKQFRMYSWVRHGCIMSPWLFIVYMDAVMKVKMWMGRRGESRDNLAFYMQMTWLCVLSQRRTRGQWWNGLLRCVGED